MKHFKELFKIFRKNSTLKHIVLVKGVYYMRRNRGVINEEKMVRALNRKPFWKLENNQKHLVEAIFGLVDDNQMIHAKLVKEHNQKPDIFIEVNGVTKYVSIKSGATIKVSEELIQSFIPYLRSKGISENSLRTICHYHFGDGTVDGSGERRLTQFQVITSLKEKINALNAELNADKKMVADFVFRAIFLGTKETNIVADYIYFGTPVYGVVCSKEQVMKYLETNNFNYIQLPHIGCLLFKPHARYSYKPVTNPKRRYTIDIYWPGLAQVLGYISERYNG